MTEVDAINKDQMFVLFDDGEIGSVCHMIDCYGDDTEDPDEAIIFVSVHPVSRQFYVIDLSYFEDTATVH